MTYKLYDWQREDLNRIAANRYTALMNLDMGAGKTVMAAFAIKESGAQITLIMAPQSTHETAWKPTVRDVVGVTPRVIGNYNKASKEAMAEFVLGVPGVYLATGQFVARTDVSNWSGDMLIWDELHQGNSPKTRLQRQMSGFYPGDPEPLNARFPMRLGLSGTPLKQSFTNAWPVARFLFPELGAPGQPAESNFFGWQARRMTYESVYTNQRDRDGNPKIVKQYLSEREPGRLIAELPCVVTHKRREACCRYHPHGFLDLDEPQVIDRIIPLLPAQRKAIKELEDHLMTYIEDNPLVTEIPLVQQTRIRQICLGVPTVRYFEVDGVEKTTLDFEPDCKSPLYDEILEILTELPSNEPVLIFMESQKFASVITRRLNEAGVSAVEYSGKTSAKDRQEYVSGFGSRYRVIVGVASAIGTGTDGLQAVCNTEIWAEVPVSLTVQQQAEGRLSRSGQRRQVQRFRLKDDTGYAEGRISDQLQMKLMLNRSLRAAH